MKYVVLNPSFSLRNETTCSFIVRKSLYINSDLSNYRTIFPIPTFIGFILSYIGKMPLQNSLDFLGDYLQISHVALQHFISQIIEKPSKSLVFQGEEFIFPEQLLVFKEQPDLTSYYTATGFVPLKAYKLCRPSMPLMVNFMVTEKCNTNCIYCYAKRDTKKEMSTSEVINIINRLSNSGVVNLTLTGGDIFARKDWYEIISSTQVAGFSYLISTKTILSQEAIVKIKHLGIREIQFSLDAISADVLHEIIKVNYHYTDDLKSMFEQCSLHGLNISLRTVLCKQNTNTHEIDKLCRFVDSNACIVSWTITPAFYSENKENYADYSVDNDMIIEVLSMLRKRKMRIRPLFNKIGTSGYKLQRTNSVEEFVQQNQICYANSYSLSILPSGACTICEMLYYNKDFILGDIKNSELASIWNSPKALELYIPRRKQMKEDSACSSCMVFDKCKRNIAKRACYVDIMKVHKRWDFPDPKCPQSPTCNYIL